MLKRLFSLFIAVVFVAVNIIPAAAQGVLLPQPGAMPGLSASFKPVVFRGIKLDPKQPFRFDFVVDQGDKPLQGEAFNDESRRLASYFLASLTIPEKDLWVNLSPYENNRIIEENFGRTTMGRDILAVDYFLKQITSSLMYPDSDLGKKFWSEVYHRAYEKFGTTDIPVDTLNKVWIVPQKAVIYEQADKEHAGVSAYIDNARLKVMLDTDYFAAAQNTVIPNEVRGSGISKDEISSAVIREVIIPVLEEEVNEGRNFAQLRQVYYSMLLAVWFKKKLTQGRVNGGHILSDIFIDRQKTVGNETADPGAEIGSIYSSYVETFKKGAYNLIKEEYDNYSQEMIPRKYFSGGISAEDIDQAIETHAASQFLGDGRIGEARVTIDLVKAAPDQNAAQSSGSSFKRIALVAILSVIVLGPLGYWGIKSLTNEQTMAKRVVGGPTSQLASDIDFLDRNYKPSLDQEGVSPDRLMETQRSIREVSLRVAKWENSGVLSEQEILGRMGLSLEDFTKLMVRIEPLMSNFDRNGFSSLEKKEIVLALAYKESSFGLNQVEVKAGKARGRGILQYDKPEYFLEDIRKIASDPLWSPFARSQWPALFSQQKIDLKTAEQWMHDSRIHLTIAMFRMDRTMGEVAESIKQPVIGKDAVFRISRKAVNKDMPRDVVCPVFKVYEDRNAHKALMAQATLLSWNVGGNRGQGFYHTVIQHIFLANSFDVKTVREMKEMQMLFNEAAEKAYFDFASKRVYDYYKLTFDKRFFLGPYFGEAWGNAYKASKAAGYEFPAYYKLSTLKEEHDNWIKSHAPKRAPSGKSKTSRKKGSSDHSMAGEDNSEKVGGVDLNSVWLNMDVQGQGGNIVYQFTPEQIRMLDEDVPGFVPVIINSAPVVNVAEFLGFK